MKKKSYIAGPLFNEHERVYLESIAENLEKDNQSDWPWLRLKNRKKFFCLYFSNN